jgi:hypothetical protein
MSGARHHWVYSGIAGMIYRLSCIAQTFAIAAKIPEAYLFVTQKSGTQLILRGLHPSKIDFSNRVSMASATN